ncbi:hypothetical protein COCCADRAFT_36442 [Bipolaris zeicola 26-R-13]|uniref:Uncharacterized protein n=1 Tax=Cochliobolus carbonum (strain 26-R-13) TaxID=930089 RepID=W6Y8I2_COCC2|nr:uncharacterized protein COCCADRAFT_36442 [Bipolaris zeicola 26-R-13]EUC33785.1 hypothetical protein COCCADRAFT_36442 [Bipolaris zeicola 26-R-13]
MPKESALPHQARHREAQEERHVGTTLIVGAGCRDLCVYFLLTHQNTPESPLFQLREIHFWKMLHPFLPWRDLQCKR